MTGFLSGRRETPPFLQNLIRTIRDTWECPTAHDFEAARDSYAAHLQEPFLAIAEEREVKLALLRSKVEAITALAPDLVERALRRTPFETQYFIGHHDENEGDQHE